MGDVVPLLPWLPASADSLVALARMPAAAAWRIARFDPGAMILMLRQAPVDQPIRITKILADAPILESALRFVDDPSLGIIDWNQSPLKSIYRSAWAHARIAACIAQRTKVDADCAWMAGMLTHLGWMAMALVEPACAAAALNDPDFAHDPIPVQRKHWNIDQADLARRLSRRWNLPRWLTLAIAHLDLPIDHAQAMGADVDLFRIIQQTVCVARRHGYILGPTTACSDGLDHDVVEEEIRVVLECSEPTLSWNDPAKTPLLADLLALAAQNRRMQRDATVERLEQDVNDLHKALRHQRDREQQHLQNMKLRALAEFAAGAGHEINNPLAVISGQAQYLLHREPDQGRQQTLNKIVQQAHRIHHVLTDLMQFARPIPPKPQSMAVNELIPEVVQALVSWAEQRQVGLRFALPDQQVSITADPRQIKTALTCLVRNAVEAAPDNGWASLRTELTGDGRIRFIVEDSGAGAPAGQREHLFDPFYSGREAGRGRGLGLSTAWQLARVNGGDLHYDADAVPTRFVLNLAIETKDAEKPKSTESIPTNGYHGPVTAIGA